MVKFKSCSRCKGDMYLNADIYGTYSECLMCGHMVNLREVVQVAKLIDKPKVAVKDKQHAA